MRRLFSSQPRLAALRRKLKHEARAPPAAAPAAPSNGSSFFIETRGCQMNVSDSEVVRSLLLDGGYGEATSAAAADVVLLNTCAIRDKAEAKVWTRLRDLRGRAPHGVKLAAPKPFAARAPRKKAPAGPKRRSPRTKSGGATYTGNATESGVLM